MELSPKLAGYKLSKTALTLSVLLSPKLQCGIKYKVNVMNLTSPYNILVVDAWAMMEGDELRIYFEDGVLGRTKSLSLEEAKQQVSAEF
ncbi:hypothetical protein ACQ4WQ_23880 [Janthinobacterium sp. GB1R12]|uniref:hypothetical protein n=1 Tax=Janthinobacterium sp. GB1R12 TaxID=3424190 RepID=UPI003F29E358